MHKPESIPDNRRRRSKAGVKGIDRVDISALSIRTELGLWVRTSLWADVNAELGDNGGPSCGYSRDFKGQHISEETCAAWVERRFPGYIAAITALLEQIKKRKLRRSETVEFKLYRFIHSGFGDKEEEDPAYRFGPDRGKRSSTRNKKISNLMWTMQNLRREYGPLLCFDFDITDPSKTPTVRTTK